MLVLWSSRALFPKSQRAIAELGLLDRVLKLFVGTEEITWIDLDDESFRLLDHH